LNHCLRLREADRANRRVAEHDRCDLLIRNPRQWRAPKQPISQPAAEAALVAEMVEVMVEVEPAMELVETRRDRGWQSQPACGWRRRPWR